MPRNGGRSSRSWGSRQNEEPLSGQCSIVIVTRVHDHAAASRHLFWPHVRVGSQAASRAAKNAGEILRLASPCKAGGWRQIHWVFRHENGTFIRGRADCIDRELPTATYRSLRFLEMAASCRRWARFQAENRSWFEPPMSSAAAFDASFFRRGHHEN